MTLRLVPPIAEREPEPFVRGEYLCVTRTPAECARYDLPYEEWLALPEAGVSDTEKGLLGQPKILCPACGSTHFGATNPTGYLLIYACHDEHFKGCRQWFRGVDGVTHSEEQQAVEILFAAFFGIGKTFVVGRAPCAS